MQNKIPFKHAEFIASAYLEQQLPVLKDACSGKPMPEIAIVGRSNVGKSSLINHLLNHKKLAKTSSTPGKTQSINFFLIDQKLALVDLPGYGYAKVAKTIREEWGTAIDQYLQTRTTLKLLLFLIDLRRIPTEEDIAFIEWAHFHKKPLLLIFTKSDKLKDAEIEKNLKIALKTINSCTPPSFLLYSIKTPKARIELIEKLNTLLVNGPAS